MAWAGGSQDALHIESFNGKLRDELLDRDLSFTLLEVRVLTERYMRTYN
ncbi:MAG: integrase core domain-containing protein [Caldilineaceae bacterium]|nr:integrase core domain-containing protein [Caldilineaceae bacterium]